MKISFSEEVDYSNEVDDTSVQYAKVGLFLYVEYEGVQAD